jgi:hypothetical protein
MRKTLDPRARTIVPFIGELAQFPCESTRSVGFANVVLSPKRIAPTAHLIDDLPMRRAAAPRIPRCGWRRKSHPHESPAPDRRGITPTRGR